LSSATIVSAEALSGILAFFPVDLDQAGLERRRLGSLKQGGDGPVFLLGEVPDLLLPVADQPERDGLDPARAQSLADLFPEQRADEVADKAVKDAPGLLGSDLVRVDVALLFKRFFDGLLGDLVEEDAPDIRVGIFEELAQVPGDGSPSRSGSAARMTAAASLAALWSSATSFCGRG